MKPNNMKTVALAAFMGVSLAACGSTPTREVYEVEQILEWYEHEGNLVIRVKSNGCSNEDSFYFYEPNARRGNQVDNTEGEEVWRDIVLPFPGSHPDSCRKLEHRC